MENAKHEVPSTLPIPQHIVKVTPEEMAFDCEVVMRVVDAAAVRGVRLVARGNNGLSDEDGERVKSDDGGVCALGVFHLGRIAPIDGWLGVPARSLGVDLEYVDGIEDGFEDYDAQPFNDADQHEVRGYMRGYAVGAALRQYAEVRE